MRIAALYDIHGNLPALDAVLDEARGAGVDLLLIGGDVFPGPLASECLDRLSGCGMPFQAIRGNGERAVLEHLDGKESTTLPAEVRSIIQWTATHLDEEHQRVLRTWPTSFALRLASETRALFVHATTRNDTEIFTERTPRDVLERIFLPLAADIVVCGHTHLQFERQLNALQIVNPGSVGMPFEEAGAYWAMLDREVTLRRTDYDRASAADQIRRSAYPGADAFADRYVLHPPARAETLDRYAQLEVR